MIRSAMFVLVRALLYGTVFVGVMLVFLPSRVLSWAGVVRPAVLGFSQLAGIAVTVAGVVLMLACVLAFAIAGSGTPAPFDPPRRLVVRGPYRVVRNPMYIGAGLSLGGAALFYGSWALVGYTAVLFVASHLFIMFYEEPALTRDFGGEYEAYRRAVRRWLPGPALRKGRS